MGTGWRSPRSRWTARYPLVISPPSGGDPLDDQQLVAAAQSGDRDALETLLRRSADRMHAVCRRVTGNDADAADATQEAMIAIVRGIGRFDGRSAFSTWTYRVATNASLDELRRRRRRPEPTADEFLDAGTPVGRGRPDGASELDAVTDRADIDDALASLTPDFRAAVVLRDLIGLEYAEIAEILELPAGTVKSRIARGRAALADRLTRAGNPTGSEDRPRTRP